MTMAKDIQLVRELLEKDIDFIKINVVSINEHLKELNGQVARNSEFRIKAKTVWGAVILIASIIGGAINLLVNKLW
jgi:hypothetical protein